MSIKLAGDTVKVFGTNLPTLYFENIDFFDTHFDITLAIYTEGEVAQRTEYEQYIEYLRTNNIKFYVTLVMDGKVSEMTQTLGTPLVQANLNLSSEADYGDETWEDFGEEMAEQALAAIVEHTVRSAAIGMGMNPVHGKDGTLAAGESVTFKPAASSALQYVPLVPHYYTPAEVGGESTNRIGRLISGQVSPLDLIRRNGEFNFGLSTAVDDYYCPEIFEVDTAKAYALGVPLVYGKDLFTNPYLTFSPYDGGSIAHGIFVDEVRAQYESIEGTEKAVVPPAVTLATKTLGFGGPPSPLASGPLDLAARKNIFSPPAYGGAAYTTIYNDPQLDAGIGFAIDYPLHTNTIKRGLDDFEEGYEEIRREDGRLVYKRVLKISQAFRGHGAPGESPGAVRFQRWQERLKLIPQTSMIAYSSMLDIDLSSIGPDTQTYNDQYTRGLVSPFDENITDPVTCARMDKSIDKLNRALVSDATYEQVARYGKVEKERFKIYVNAEGHEYEGDAIQDINGSYYGVPNLTYEDVAQVFEEFLATSAGMPSYHQRSAEHTPVVDLENRIKAAIASHADKPSLLPKLNYIRRTIPDTTTATGTGRFYLKFRDTLANINQVIQNNGIPLKISYGVSQVVNDRRSYKYSPWSPPELPNNDPSIGYINPWLSRVSKFGDRYMSAQHQDRGPQQQTDSASDFWNDTGNSIVNDGYVLGDKMDIYINGYYFFDYERAINQASNIARILDVKKLERLYGRRITQNHYRLFSNEAKLGTVPGTHNFSYSSDPSLEWTVWTDLEALGDVAIGVPSTQYHTGKAIPYVAADPAGSLFRENKGSVVAFYADDNYPLTKPTSVFLGQQATSPETPDMASGEFYNGMPRAYRDVPDDAGYIQDNGLYGQESREYSYTCLRNFEFPELLLNPNNGLYRLMCFEFQFVIPEQNTQTMQDPCYNDYLQFNAVVLDDTEKVFEGLYKHYQHSFQIMKQYAEEAAEFCNYSNLDNTFNDFFAESQEAKYEANIGKAPWFVVPLTYLIMKDLFANDFGGDMDSIKAKAAEMARDISPRTGNLINIGIFLQAMTELETGYFIATGIEGAQNPADMYLEVLADGIISPRFRTFGGDGKSPNASNRFPLPTLQEALLTPQVPMELPTIAPITITPEKSAPMVKMHFSAVNMPQTICATPYRDNAHRPAGQIHHGTMVGESSWHGNWQQNYIFLEIRNHPDNFVNFPNFPWDRNSDGSIVEDSHGMYQTYKVAYYSQFAFTAKNKLTKKFDYYSDRFGARGKSVGDMSETMGYGGFVDIGRTLLTTPKWNKGGRFEDTVGKQNRTGETPIWRSIWLYAGMRYIIRWYIGGGSNIGGEMEYNTSPSHDTWTDIHPTEHPIGDTLWSSSPIVIDVPVPERLENSIESNVWLASFTPNLTSNWPTQQLNDGVNDWSNLALAGEMLKVSVGSDIPRTHTGNDANIPNKFTHYWIDGLLLWVEHPTGKQIDAGYTVYSPTTNGVNLMAKAVMPDPLASTEFKGYTYKIKNCTMPPGTKSETQFTGVPMFGSSIRVGSESYRAMVTRDYISGVKWGAVGAGFAGDNGNMPSTRHIVGDS